MPQLYCLLFKDTHRGKLPLMMGSVPGWVPAMLTAPNDGHRVECSDHRRFFLSDGWGRAAV